MQYQLSGSTILLLCKTMHHVIKHQSFFGIFNKTGFRLRGGRRIPLTSIPSNIFDIHSRTIFHNWFITTHKESSQSNEAMQQYAEGLKVAWSEIGLELAKRLVESMLQRIQAVISERGGATKY